MATPYQPAPGYPSPAAPSPRQGNGLAVAGMVLGILGLVLCWVPFVGAICALVGIILGALGIGKAKRVGAGKGMAIAGLVCGIVGIAIGIFFIVMTLFVASTVEYMKKTKSSEARLQLRSIEVKAKTFYNEKGRFPASASMMPGPAGSACSGGTMTIPHQPRSAWDAAGWKELGFAVDEDSRYSYQWTVQGPQHAEAIAVGDLDCDGTTSTSTLKLDVVDGNVMATYDEPTPD